MSENHCRVRRYVSVRQSRPFLSRMKKFELPEASAPTRQRLMP